MRTYQFLPRWNQAGVAYKVSPFFNEAYLKKFYSEEKRSIWNMMSCYVRRLRILAAFWKYDLIWIEKELFPFTPSYAEWILARLGKGYVVDYDDAVFHNYDKHRNPIIRYWMGDKIAWVMRNSKQVLAGNKYLAAYAMTSGAKNVSMLPTVVDLKGYPLKKIHSGSRVRIGWIGSPTTLKYVASISESIRNLGKSYPIEFLIINAADTAVPDMGVPVRLIPWSEEKEGEMIAEMDIGIMPLPDDKWERGKCAYKLIQYMACGLPVVASPVGMNKDVVRHGENGFLADSQSEWIFYLEILIKDAALRTQMGNAGRALVEREYTVEKNFRKMMGVLGVKGNRRMRE